MRNVSIAQLRSAVASKFDAEAVRSQTTAYATKAYNKLVAFTVFIIVTVLNLWKSLLASKNYEKVQTRIEATSIPERWTATEKQREAALEKATAVLAKVEEKAKAIDTKYNGGLGAAFVTDVKASYAEATKPDEETKTEETKQE